MTVRIVGTADPKEYKTTCTNQKCRRILAFNADDTNEAGSVQCPRCDTWMPRALHRVEPSEITSFGFDRIYPDVQGRWVDVEWSPTAVRFVMEPASPCLGEDGIPDRPGRVF